MRSAQDRAFRIGQKRDVTVFRFVAAGTVEEVIYNRQIYKTQQSNIALQGGKETRWYEGVQDDKNNLGELWGLANLLQHDTADMAQHRRARGPDAGARSYLSGQLSADYASSSAPCNGRVHGVGGSGCKATHVGFRIETVQQGSTEQQGSVKDELLLDGQGVGEERRDGRFGLALDVDADLLDLDTPLEGVRKSLSREQEDEEADEDEQADDEEDSQEDGAVAAGVSSAAAAVVVAAAVPGQQSQKQRDPIAVRQTGGLTDDGCNTQPNTKAGRRAAKQQQQQQQEMESLLSERRSKSSRSSSDSYTWSSGSLSSSRRSYEQDAGCLAPPVPTSFVSRRALDLSQKFPQPQQYPVQ
ncbi:MAG: hypothetical protein WDW36_004275 [Sanguina aurantia]